MDGIAQQLLPLASDPQRLARLHQALGDYCHTLRNRLNSLKLGIYLMRREHGVGGPWAGVERRYQEIEQFVEQFQTFYRPPVLLPLPVSLGTVLAERRAAWAALLMVRNRALIWQPLEQDAICQLDPAQFSAALDTLVAWRAAVGPEGCSVQVGWCLRGGHLQLTWDETEAGGGPFDEAGDRPPSLALPLLSRMAVAHGGSLRIAIEPGFRVEVHLPVTAGPAGHSRPTPLGSAVGVLANDGSQYSATDRSGGGGGPEDAGGGRRPLARSTARPEADRATS